MIITLRRSRLLDFLLVSIHALSALALFLVALPTPVRIVTFGFIVASLVRALRRESFTSLKLSAENAGQICFGRAASCVLVADILPETAVFLFLVVLRLREEGDQAHFQVILLPDQMSKDEFRRIRVWLRWRLTNDAGSPSSSPL
ncbi:protein YgfX [Propionivibrio dicarboxylicus]|uniref:Toxin CptA n=1 Tax=Propionivibrio dicarboxylicus TaxID=83767 RepID=A0A1G8D6P3_9RHOO|nr:protein YgfX [Propionivibrio dicarboxylicus]SDH52940.1 toxin CptA [Propionivibrio dicarboxylicus]